MVGVLVVVLVQDRVDLAQEGAAHWVGRIAGARGTGDVIDGSGAALGEARGIVDAHGRCLAHVATNVVGPFREAGTQVEGRVARALHDVAQIQ